MTEESALEILYLHDHPGKKFCRTCLARLAAQDRTFRARNGKPHEEVLDRCSECGQYTQVLTVQA